ncbi:MAG: hypothetical protein KF861_07995, partial [Planctomycetaceae bacterium]|nr:hypothetical protein [Planctomycetaceae bacterium]
MKKTWKYVLTALAVSAVLGGSLVAQTDDGVVVIGKNRGGAASPPAGTPATGLARAGTAATPGSTSQDRWVTPTSASSVVQAGPAPETVSP